MSVHTSILGPYSVIKPDTDNKDLSNVCYFDLKNYLDKNISINRILLFLLKFSLAIPNES